MIRQGRPQPPLLSASTAASRRESEDTIRSLRSFGSARTLVEQDDMSSPETTRTSAASERRRSHGIGGAGNICTRFLVVEIQSTC